ncbi:MAG: hypothetical protein M3Y22_03665, partial [Pseudomonadota bacterium]|nr:hypothetical protein [Pseudomonadota bacterium]
MSVNAWWLSDPNERYWLELTDREDIGGELRAPVADGSGKDNWRYTLFKLTGVGDVVFHYDTSQDAIVGLSEVAGTPYEADLVWGARGTA